MAIKYVDSAATGLNDGTSWTDAWTSWESATGVAAGDVILISHTHDETSAATTVDFSNATMASPVSLISTNSSSGAYQAGATIRHTANSSKTITGLGLRFWGVSILYSASDSYRVVTLMNAEAYGYGEFTDCTFDCANGRVGVLTGSRCSRARFVNCTFNTGNYGSSAIYISSNDNTYVDFVGCTITTTATGTANSVVGAGLVNDDMHWSFTACDLSDSSFGYISDEAADDGVVMTVRDCFLSPNHVGLFKTTPTNAISRGLIERSTNTTGGLTVPALGIQQLETWLGTVKSDLTRYRTGGADDGEQANAHSWEMASTASATEELHALESPPIVRWVNGGTSITLTFYVASGATLNNDDLWVELITPDDTATSTTQGDHRTSKMLPRATPAALTTDSDSTWTGTGVGTKQKITFTFTPDIAGPVVARFFLAKPSTTVYVDPVIAIDGNTSGNSFVAEGVQLSKTSVGGSGARHPLARF